MSRSDFWSRRRAAVAAADHAAQDAELAAQRAAEETAIADRPDEELLAEAGLPAPEALQTPDEVQAFLKSALPRRLKTRALRQLWGLNPVLANLDGLVEYGEDYTDAATVVENLQTAYQVGKGMLTRLEEVTEPAAEDDGTAQDDAPPVAAIEPEAPPQVAAMIEPAPPPAIEDTDEPVLRPAPSRRMRFRFET